ncbi:MAG: hypothetical protein IJV33_10500 [Bacteroidaceae bacterium]|nr:hypothetical protein [Bacteroidaceae bacterium]
MLFIYQIRSMKTNVRKRPFDAGQPYASARDTHCEHTKYLCKESRHPTVGSIRRKGRLAHL